MDSFSDSNSIQYPKDLDEVNELGNEPTNVVHREQFGDHEGGPRILRFKPGILLKFGGFELAEEVLCAQYARNKLGLPVPRVLHHPGSLHHRDTQIWKDLDELGRPRLSPSVWYYCMEEIRGVSLDKVVDKLSKEQQLHIAQQLTQILERMRAQKSTTLGSISGDPYRTLLCVPQPLQPKSTFNTISEFRKFFYDLLRCYRFEWQVEQVMSPQPINGNIHFTHGDLVPKNIMVYGSTITGIIDWANAGYYPDYWEYARMHDPNFRTPGWSSILEIVFPEQRRDKEINSVSQMLMEISWALN